MTGSYAAINTQQMPLGPCKVLFGTPEVDVGGVANGVTVSLETSLAEKKADQTGDTVLDNVVSGQKYKIKMTLLEAENKELWAFGFGQTADLVGTGSNGAIDFIAKIGQSLKDLAKTMRIHPLSKAESDKSMDFNFYKVTCLGSAEYKHSPTDQSGIELEFNVYPDTSVVPYQFFRLGDPTFTPGTYASKVIQNLTYTAKLPGVGGNLINIVYVEDGTAGAEAVVVAGNVITVHIGDSGVLSSTSNQVKTAVTNNIPAMNLLGSVTGGDNVADQVAGNVFLQGGT